MPDPFDRDRLLHYGNKLSDADAGVRAAAARGMASFVKQHGLSWDNLIVKVETQAGVQVAPTDDWPHVKFVERLLVDPGAKLSSFEEEFCENLKNWRRPPTEKQAAVL